MSLQGRRNAWVLVAATLGVLSSGAARTEEPAAKAEQEEVGTAKGRWEFSTGASFNSYRDGGYPLHVVSVPLRVGDLVSDHLELEGEALPETHKWLSDNHTERGLSGISAGVLYHFKARSRVTPFVLLGAGVESLALLGFPGWWPYFERPFESIHGGAGVKAFVGRHAALRVEYRYKHFFGRDDDKDYTYRTNTHRVFVGISLWTR